MLTGENGILTQAQNAKKQTSIAEEKEQIALAYNAVKAEEKGGTVTADKLDKELEKDGADATQEGTNIKVNFRESKREYIIDENGTITDGTGTTPPAGDDDEATVGEIVQPGEGNKEYTSGEYTAIIPEGFMIVPGLDNIEEGLVISDNSSDTEAESSNIVANGNQFVWVPVTTTYARNTSYLNTNVSAQAYTDTGYLPDGIQPTTDDSTNNENSEREAVTSKGGFYISRYEAGKETSGDTNKLVSKSGATVWNRISQANCKTEAKKFINNDNVKSALCSGIQWDMTMAFVNNKQDGANNTFDVTTNGDRGGSSLATSGQNLADKVCNIFDLEENYLEYVAEKSSFFTGGPFVIRGGVYNRTDPASYRVSIDGLANTPRSFRFVLYVM